MGFMRHFWAIKLADCLLCFYFCLKWHGLDGVGLLVDVYTARRCILRHHAHDTHGMSRKSITSKIDIGITKAGVRDNELIRFAVDCRHVTVSLIAQLSGGTLT